MWGKIFLVTTGLLSLSYFLFPENFQLFDTKDSDVLGIQKINAQVNKSSVETALTIYCVDTGKLPKKLNDLYGGYLDDRIRIDLSSLYKYEPGRDCHYRLINR